MKWSKQKYSSMLSALACCLSVFITSGFSQSPVPTIEDLEDHKQLIISEEAKQIAEEYADILKELQELTLDYSRTFVKLPRGSSIPRLQELNSLIIKLAHGEYLEDIKLLTTDLDMVREKLLEQEKEIKEKAKFLKKQERKDALKAYKLSRSLRGDLKAFNIVLQEDINFRLQSLEFLADEIQICLNQISHDDLQLYSESITSYIMIITDSINDIVNLTMDSYPQTYEVGEVPDINFQVINVPDVPDAEIIIDPVLDTPRGTKSFSYVYQPKSGNTIATIEYSDDLKIKSSSIPIYINNPTGVLQVTGWDKKTILATSILEISSSSGNKAQTLTDNVDLSLNADDTGIYIDFSMPKIRSSNISIANFQLEIKVPRNNPIFGKSSFGMVIMSNLHNKVFLEAHKSHVSAKGIIGNVQISNNNGPINIEEIDGSIDVTNNFAPIIISQCEGDIKAKNTFAAIKIIECDGDIVINNSGQINLYDNIGNITITNTKGFINIKDHQGNIFAKNSFEPIILEDINGAVNVANKRGTIKAQYIEGSFKAENLYAPIFAYYNEGLLDLSITRGFIDVIWTGSEDGTSTITSQFGDVKIAFPEDLDLDFKAKVNDGLITSSFPISVKTTNNTKEAEYIFGDGGPTLIVNGKNSEVTLSCSR